MKKIRLILALPFLIISLTLLAWASLPVGHEARRQYIEPTQMQVSTPQAASTREPSLPVEILPQPAVAESRMLTVEFPPQIRAGDSDLIRLTLEVDEFGNLTATAESAGNVTQGEVVQIPNVYDTHNVVAEARLDMAGVQINPIGTISESLRPGQLVTYYWSVRAEEIGIYRGTLWFYLNFVPLDGGPEQRQALSAQKIEIEAVNFFGLKAQLARFLGAAGTLLSAVLGMPFLEGTLKWLWRRVKRQPGFG